MRKEEFLNELRKKLAGLPKDDVDSRVEFYSEMIDDRIEEGKSEQEAIAEIGNVDDIVNDIAKDTPFVKLVKEKVKPKRALQTWEIVLLVLGFPLWFPLAVTGLSLCLVGYFLIWVFDLVACAVELALGASGIGGLVVFFASLANPGNTNMMALGIGLIGFGGAFIFYWVCVAMTKGTFRLSMKITNKIKAAFIRKGRD